MVQPSRIQLLYRLWAEPPGQVIAATAFLPDTMTAGFAAWRARPSGPDVWANTLTRHISPLLPPRTRAGKEGKKKYGIRLYPRKNVHVSAAHILCFLLYYNTTSCVCKSNFRFLYQYIVFSGVIKRPPHHILYLIACIKVFFCSSLFAPKVCIRHASSDLAPPPCSAVFSYHRLV